MRMENFLSNTLVTLLWVVVLAVCYTSLVLCQESNNDLQQNNYGRVPCTFEDNLCGWTSLNSKDLWKRERDCNRKFLWWCTRKTEYYLQLKMDKLAENSTLSSPLLAARPNVRCQLVFLCSIDCDTDSCQLSVERQGDTGVTELVWNVTKCPTDGKRVHVTVPCSDESYKILFVGRKVERAGRGYINLDNIQFHLNTVPMTTEGITSLSRRVSLTFSSTLPATTPALVSTSEEQDTEPMVRSDQQTGNDGLTTGSVAAIVVVAVLLVIIIVVIAVIVVRRQKAAVKIKRTSGSDDSSFPSSARGNNRGHDNPVYSVTGYELNTMRDLRTDNEGPDISPDYYNTTGQNSAQAAAPTQDGVYVNTASPPQPQDEYAVPEKSGQKKTEQGNQKPEDEYAIPEKSGQKETEQGSQKLEDEYATPEKSGQQKKTMQETPKPEEDYALPNKGPNKKKKQTEQDRQQKTENRNRKKKGKKRAAESTDYENVGANGAGRLSPPSVSSHPHPPEDTYNELGARERTGVQVGEPPLNHYDRINATDDG